MKKYPTVLSIAGSDPSGGAGIQADIKTCCAFGVYAMTAITAVTAQNTTGVDSYTAVAPEMLRAQLRCVCSDIMPDAVKIGMVPDADSAHAIADAIEQYQLKNIVLDPVLVATSGDRLSEGNAIDVLKERVFDHADIITPNLPEAEYLMHRYADAKLSRPRSCRLAEALGLKRVLLKGGHMEGNLLVDQFYDADKNLYGLVNLREFEHLKIDTPNTHGTGCSLSSAIACGLATGLDIEAACEQAITWLHGAIISGKDYKIGHGHGPVNFFSTKE